MRVINVVSVRTQTSVRPVKNRGNTESYQLGIKFTGHSELRYRGNIIDFRAGTVAYLPKEETVDIDYTTRTFDSGNGVCIFFDSDVPLPCDPQMLCDANSEIQDAFLQVLHTFIRSDQYCYPDVMAAFYTLLGKLYRQKNVADVSEGVGARFAPAVQYMKDHWNDEYISISALADMVGTTEKYFRDTFKRVYGVSPLKYFHKCKMANIRQLISDMTLTVNDIARMSGFSDANYFSRFFKKHLGISPSEYRNYYCR